MIQTEAPGLNPEQVEVLVTQPVEVAVNGLPGVVSLRSSSIQGLSVITVTFGAGSDIYRVRQLVTERLTALAGRLPQGVLPPAMTALTSATSTVLLVGLTDRRRRSDMDLRTLADWTVRLRLLAVPGIAQVSVYGGAVRSLQVQIRPQRPRALQHRRQRRAGRRAQGHRRARAPASSTRPTSASPSRPTGSR